MAPGVVRLPYLDCGGFAVSNENRDITTTILGLRPVLPAIDHELSMRFYTDVGFKAEILADGLAEIHLGNYSFLLQRYYVKEWADNSVIHLRVSDVRCWWDHIAKLDLPGRYGVKARPPQNEEWAVVVGITDPSGVLWRIFQAA